MSECFDGVLRVITACLQGVFGSSFAEFPAYSECAPDRVRRLMREHGLIALVSALPSLAGLFGVVSKRAMDAVALLKDELHKATGASSPRERRLWSDKNHRRIEIRPRPQMVSSRRKAM